MPLLSDPLRRALTRTALLLAALCPLSMPAAGGEPGWSGRQTLALELVGARSELGKTADRGQFGTGVVIDGIPDGAFRSGSEVDTSAAVGVRFDQDVTDHLTAGLMAHWHFPVDWDISARTPAIQTITNTFTNVERAVVLARLGYRRPLEGRWELRATAAAGVAQQHLDIVYTERAVPGVRPEQRSTDRHRVTRTAWALEAGIHRSLGRRFQLGLLYRYLDSGDLSVRARPDSVARLDATLRDHLFVLSLGWQRR